MYNEPFYLVHCIKPDGRQRVMTCIARTESHQIYLTNDHQKEFLAAFHVRRCKVHFGCMEKKISRNFYALLPFFLSFFLPVTICFRSCQNYVKQFVQQCMMGGTPTNNVSFNYASVVIGFCGYVALLEKMSHRIATDYIIYSIGYLLLLATLNAMKPHS